MVAIDPAGLAERAARVLPGGATHVARSYRPPIHVVRSRGSRKWLVDGRELVDYTMGHGALILGHAHPAIVEAVRAQVGDGTHFGAASPLEVEWAERISSLVGSVDEVRFTSSGTEATMLALRLAHAATGRDRVAKLDDHFHGWHDAVSVNLDPSGTPLPALGVPGPAGALTRVVPANHLERLHEALADGSVAALILEPSGAHYGESPLDPGYVAAARRLCTETGTLLVFDEVVTGFRVDPGGMQALLDVRPELSAFGKVMAGGLPGAAVGGRRDLMELLAVPPDGSGEYIAHPGTFNANPLSAAAGLAALTAVAERGACERATAFAARLEDVIRGALDSAGVSGRAWRLASIVHVRLDDPSAHAGLGRSLRDHGVDLLHTSAFCSAVHDDADLEDTARAFAAALAGT